MQAQPLKLLIAPGDPRPIFKQIVDGVRLQIAKGALLPGSKLPSVRALAQQLLINPNTVAKAYNELSSQGYLESRKGLGIFVKERRQMLSLQEQERRLELAINAFFHEVVGLDFSQEQLLDALKQKLSELNQ